jgi:hypothetical protein
MGWGRWKGYKASGRKGGRSASKQKILVKARNERDEK